MAPYITFFSWQLRSDRKGNLRIAEAERGPLRNCDCPYCLNWRRAGAPALPVVVHDVFPALGLDPTRPDGLYPSDWPSRTLKCRVTFHSATTIIDGPPSEVRRNGVLEQPEYEVAPGILCTLQPQDPTRGIGVPWSPKQPPSLLQIAFRLTIPWVEDPIEPNRGLHKPL